MVARFHYDPRVYRQFLDDKLADTQHKEVNKHVEGCRACQAKLEAILQDDIGWDDIPGLLNPDEKQCGQEIANGKQTRTSPRPEFLAKSDRPNSLGRFGRYEIVEVLGSGGMGVVMKGFDPALNRCSAIKVLAPVLATSASARQRFAREAKSAAAVAHEHVVPIQTVDEENGLPYLVMPVIDGQSLQQRVEETGPLEVKEVLRVGMQIASGLAAAHAQGLVHRDIKPANVLLENGVERVMLTDFGLARAADDANMTQSGVLAGTPQYMSPEQARGSDVDHRSDLFSLGSVLYFMCAGRSPFRAETTMGVLHRITNDDPRPIRTVNADVPPWLQDIIDRLLSKNKDCRFQTAAGVAHVLSQWLAYLQQPDVAAKPQMLKPDSRSSHCFNGRARKWLAAVAGMLLAFAGILITLELNKGTLTIECAKDGVPIRIMKDDKVHRKLTVDRGATATRISAGEYVVEIDGQADGLEVKDGAVVLLSRGDALARIVQTESGMGKDSDDQAEVVVAEHGDKKAVQRILDEAGDSSRSVQIEFVEGLDVTVVRGRKDDVDRVVSAISKIGSDDANDAATNRVFRVYKMATGAKEIVEVLETIFAGSDGAHMRLEAESDRILAYATEQQHRIIEQVMEEIRRDAKGRADDVRAGDDTGTAEDHAEAGVNKLQKKVPGQLRLAFRHVPWQNALAWIAQQTESSLDLDLVPKGTFSFEDSSRTYSPAEAFDVINEALYRKGYSLIRRDKRMYIVDLEDDQDGKLVQDLLIVTTEGDLEKRGDFELTKCRFDVEPGDMQSMGEDIKRLLGPHGSMVVLPGLLLVVDIGRNLRLIRSAIHDQ